MTSAPVKDVGALMNFIGGKNLTKTGGTDLMSSFGDAMSKATGGNSGTDSQSQAVSDKKMTETKPAEALKSRKDVVKAEKSEAKTEKPENITSEQEQAMKAVGEKVAEEIARELGVTEEEVVRAMEELGISIYALLEPANLTQLVLELSGGQDAASLLTDETLFVQLQNLLGFAADVKNGLMQDMSLNPEEMQMLMEEFQKNPQLQLEETDISEKPVEVVLDNEDAPQKALEDTPQITVEVKSGGDTVKLVADENGNTAKTIEVVPHDKETAGQQKTGGQENESGKESKGQSEGTLHTGNPLLDSLLQTKVQVADAVPEQMPAFFNRQTQDIMNQIMDYMKIQLNPEMDQLEMQLHPESLGTVHIQLTSKGGEVTAQFQVQNETVRAALESQITTLQESLKEQGIKVEAVQVTVENHGFESNLWQGQGREENASSQNQKKAPRRINLNDLDGLFEEQASEEEMLVAKMMEANGNTVDYTA